MGGSTFGACRSPSAMSGSPRRCAGRARRGRRRRPLVGLQARDRVVEVGVAANVVLGPGGEREREAEARRWPRRGGDPLRRMVALVEPARGVEVSIEPPTAPAGARDRPRGIRGVRAEAVLEVDRDTAAPLASVEQGMCSATSSSVTAPSRRPSVNAKPELVVASALKPSPLEHAGRAGVPRIGDHEGVALVERPEHTRPCGLLSGMLTPPRAATPETTLPRVSRDQAALERRAGVGQLEAPRRSPGAARRRRSARRSRGAARGLARRRSRRRRLSAVSPPQPTEPPASRSTAGERRSWSPPAVSNTRSTGSIGGLEAGVSLVNDLVGAERSAPRRHYELETVADHVGAAPGASCVANCPTPPVAPWIRTRSYVESCPWS